MPKYVFCAECGERLDILIKAVPSQRKVYPIIKPHICKESPSTEELGEIMTKESKKESPTNLDSIFDKFKFVKKLNKLSPKPPPMEMETGDKRDKEHLRKELVTSTAPMSLLDRLKTMPNSIPDGDISEEPDE